MIINQLNTGCPKPPVQQLPLLHWPWTILSATCVPLDDLLKSPLNPYIKKDTTKIKKYLCYYINHCVTKLPTKYEMQS